MRAGRLLTRVAAGLLVLAAGIPATAAAASHPRPTTMATVTPSTSTTVGEVAPDLAVQLRRIKGLTVTERPAPKGYRFFSMSFTQLVDHDRPALGTFQQRLTLTHRGFDRPTVLYTSGYNLQGGPLVDFSRSEPATILDANQISLEYRFFSPSIPAHPHWTAEDTIRQAAIDEHVIIVALKAIYRHPWLTTGASKGGMTAVYHRRFFPHDVNGTIAYVAPNDVNDKVDSYNAFLDRVGTQSCRDRLTALQRYVLGPKLSWFRARATTETQEAGLTYSVVTSNLGRDRAFSIAYSVEDGVANMPFAFWMYRPPSYCAYIPVPGTNSDEDIYDWFGSISSLTNDADQNLRPYVPYYFQASYQLGAPETYETHIRDLLKFPGIVGQPYMAVPRSIRPAHFDAAAMPDIDRWVRTGSTHMLFLYGSDDPYGAEQFSCGTAGASRQCYRFVAFGRNHSSTLIATLSPAARAASLRLIRSWAGVPQSARSGSAAPVAPQRGSGVTVRFGVVPTAG